MATPVSCQLYPPLPPLPFLPPPPTPFLPFLPPRFSLPPKRVLMKINRGRLLTATAAARQLMRGRPRPWREWGNGPGRHQVRFFGGEALFSTKK
jgi:hypothetical protein